MSATAALTGALQKLVLRLEGDLRARVDADPEVLGRWKREHDEALQRGRTASAWLDWRNDRVTQAAVAWVLTTVFIRFCEDNGLVGPVWISGPGQRRQEALDARDSFFREHPEDTDREWLEQAIAHLRGLRATAALMDEHSALHLVSPSGQASTQVLEFWWQRDETGAPVHDLSDPTLSTRFLGDLYQDLSLYAKATYALLQTPVFVEEFILDRTLEPALADRPLEGFRMIDPACGSGHFLLGSFARLLDRWHRLAPGMEVQARVQTALNAIHGVDLNPFAVAIARFRLTIAALQACGLRSLENAPAFEFHVAVGDSLLHGGQLKLELGEAHDRSDATLSGFTYSTEDLTTLRSILEPGRYDAVVGNPPYITVKDSALNEAYRRRYATCKGTYALTVPFMERFFDLAKSSVGDQPAGWVGQITSNSFMKREFGSKLVETFLVGLDLRLVADTSGAYIPGHGTPTVIVVGRNQLPVGSSVRGVLGIRRDAKNPEDPAKGVVWRAIVEHVDDPGWSDGWITVSDLDRSRLASHPWNLMGGGAGELMGRLSVLSKGVVGDHAKRIGFMAMSHADEAFLQPATLVHRLHLEPRFWPPVVEGVSVRDYAATSQVSGWFPYRDGSLIALEEARGSARVLWPLRAELENRATFGKGTYRSDGRPWFEWHQFQRQAGSISLSITFASVATHNHFALDRGGKVLKQSAPVIELPVGATERQHLGLLGILNSSTACFWLKQVCYDKGAGGISEGIKAESWEHFRDINGSNVAELPLPRALAAESGKHLDALARELGENTPQAVGASGVPKIVSLEQARSAHERIRSEMIARQEELDWEVYRLYGLIDVDLAYKGPDLPGLALGERAFEITLARAIAAGTEETAWFERHGSTPITELPSSWPAAYRELVQRRLDLIDSDQAIRLLEKPDYKRRWAAEPWEKQEKAAIRNWMLDRLEDRRFWFDPQGRPSPRSIAGLADDVARDPDLVGVVALWEGRPDLSLTRSLTRLLEDEVVPYLAAYRYKDSGLAKREAWEETWTLQRREDAGEQVGTIAVPPKYTTGDFRKTPYWQHRGKLDVPKERFILYPSAGRDTDPTELLGWAGWDYAQQALALSQVIGAREAEGWPDDRLVPMIAGLAELQPWVEQWHAELDPKFGVSLAAFCREQLAQRMAQVGRSIEDLRAWRPQATGTRIPIAP